MIVLIVKFFERIMIFLSTFINKIDAKGRVSVPSSFRSVLEESGFKGMICYPSPVLDSVEGCGFNRIKKLSDTIDALGPFSKERSAFSTSLLADSHQLSFDTEGRVILPNKLVEFASIKDQVSFVGMGETFQMWDPDKYSEFQNKTFKQSQESLANLKWNND
ncbi:division/cell wall cluster transcriptional repressor MraZ [Pelagibacterales bacterium]|jgi:MraZ protein|nr:division/cell wall cluster transcriptional repressor MraZ [Pelagibacterales bacterium]